MLNKSEDETLEEYLTGKVFAGKMGTKIDPNPEDVEGFNEFIKHYTNGLAIERAAIDNF